MAAVAVAVGVLAGPFLPQHAAQNPRHGRRGVVGVRQETLELHLPNLLKVGREPRILKRSGNGRRDNQLTLGVGQRGVHDQLDLGRELDVGTRVGQRHGIVREPLDHGFLRAVRLEGEQAQATPALLEQKQQIEGEMRAALAALEAKHAYERA